MFTETAPIPGLDLAGLIGLLAQFLVAMLRIGAFLVASPVFGGRFVPLPVRILASVVLTLPVFLQVPMPAPERIFSFQFIPVALAEMAIGLSGGMVMTILFGAAATAGDRIASTAGLGFASQVDPSAGGQSPVVSQIFGLFLTMVFLAGDGHLAAIRIILESYAIAPPDTRPDLPRLVLAGVAAGGGMFALATMIMLPVVATLLMVNLTIGVITRSAPQMNIFSFGFPLTMTATIVLLYLTAPGTAVSFEGIVAQALGALSGMVGAP